MVSHKIVEAPIVGITSGLVEILPWFAVSTYLIKTSLPCEFCLRSDLQIMNLFVIFVQ